MPWHVTLYNVLTVINNVILIIIGIPFTLQVLYMLLFWLPKKTFPKSEKQHRICVVISAHNEEDVIYNTVKRLFDRQTYPKELFDVFVCAHNCTDKTAERARAAGAIVYVFNDPDPKHAMVSYALKYLYNEILNCGTGYDFSIRLDADNHVNDEFFSLMNDAFSCGVQIARPYESALNMLQNQFTRACGLYYIFDSRFSSRVRERLHLDAHVNGPGSMTDMAIIKKIGGYDTKSICEDTEFCFKRMLDGYKCHFVEDAVVYEDLPSSLKDTMNRNRRIASGNVRLLGRYTPRMLLNTVTQFRFSFLEQLLTYFFMIICLLLCTWLPAYYIYAAIYLGLNGLFTTAAASAVGLTGVGLYPLLIIIAIALGALFMVMGISQGVLLVLLDYKKMGATKRSQLLSGALLFPFFTVVYCVTMAIGIFCKPKWNKINRNTGEGGGIPADAPQNGLSNGNEEKTE